MIFAGIVAGGTGTRLGSDIPKQFLMLGTKPVIVHTVEKFLICEKFDAVVIGVHENWTSYAEDMFKKFGISSKKIIFSLGGKDRNLTIMNIISKIEEIFGKSDDHILVTHDAVRPFVTLRIIEENIESAKIFGACDTVVQSNDTIVQSDVNIQEIFEIPNRKYMFLGQTPQSFNMKKLKDLFNLLPQDKKNELTDACKIFSLNNQKVKLVFGEFSNFKITTMSDYKMAQSLLELKFD